MLLRIHIKTQGDYSLKVTAVQSVSINDTLTRVVTPTVDLSDQGEFKFDAQASRTGSNFKVELHDSGGNTIVGTVNITQVNTFQGVVVDISDVANVDKDAIDQIKVTILNAD